LGDRKRKPEDTNRSVKSVREGGLTRVLAIIGVEKEDLKNIEKAVEGEHQKKN